MVDDPDDAIGADAEADVEATIFTCDECRRRMVRVCDLVVTESRQAKIFARALRTPPDLCFQCALVPGWFMDPDRAHAIYSAAADGDISSMEVAGHG